MKEKNIRVLSVRFPEELLKRVADASSRSNFSQQDIIRMAIEIGLRDLKDANLDIPEMIRLAAQTNRAAAKAQKPKKEE